MLLGLSFSSPRTPTAGAAWRCRSPNDGGMWDAAEDEDDDVPAPVKRFEDPKGMLMVGRGLSNNASNYLPIGSSGPEARVK